MSLDYPWVVLLARGLKNEGQDRETTRDLLGELGVWHEDVDHALLEVYGDDGTDRAGPATGSGGVRHTRGDATDQLSLGFMRGAGLLDQDEAGEVDDGEP